MLGIIIDAKPAIVATLANRENSQRGCQASECRNFIAITTKPMDEPTYSTRPELLWICCRSGPVAGHPGSQGKNAAIT
jgi:hypothetical protein